MYNEDFIDYLNSLHNYNAQNHNSYGEKNVYNKFFKEVMVPSRISEIILDKLANESPHVIILTGHAGDGKTSIMYQVFAGTGAKFDAKEKKKTIVLSNNVECLCIKDFSEIADDNKKDDLKQALDMPKKGSYAFVVANTGPLINTFGELFDSVEEKENAKIELISAMDSNTAEITNIRGYKICVINVATADNTGFATEFIGKLVQDKLWEGCALCGKKDKCHIKINRESIKSNLEQVCKFLDMHYIWLAEHGKRLTVRSMTEQLAYMITAGENCSTVGKVEPYKYLFTNLFFGYFGTLKNPKAYNIIAVKEAANCGYDKKRLRSDENYIVTRNYDNVFEKTMASIIKEAEVDNAFASGWSEFLRRAYFFTNIETDQNAVDYDYEDVFSRQFKRFLELQNDNSKPTRNDVNLICDALSMIYIGTTMRDKTLYITLSRESGLSQNVQVGLGSISTKQIKIVLQQNKLDLFSEEKKNSLKLEINNRILNNEITLPLLNYFDELKNGIISTNIDPQLSHGIESLKAELAEFIGEEENEDDLFEMIILKNSGPETVSLEISDKITER